MELTEKMFELVEEYQRSGKTQKQYSEQIGIGYAKFNYWVCKYRDHHQLQPAGGFVSVEAYAANQQQNLEICYPNGVKLTISEADLSLISQLIRLY
jgi:transposase-like protein